MCTITFTVTEASVGGAMGRVYQASVTLEAGFGPVLL